jgi:3'-phosphoadenosine 5'-phosphosulfate sulfotransferase (PAPS reductase)/FAD synthetase
MTEPTKSQIMASQLKQYQSLSLNAKVTLSKQRIQQWLDHWEDQCYVAFSGGKDSTVLLDLVWSINPRIPAVFVDTGLEYPEIREFVKSYGDRVAWLKPKMPFNQVIEEYGYPILSKKISMGVSRYRNTTSQVQRDLRLHGGTNPTSGKKQERTIPIKFHHLVDAPFKISEQCCDVMKKKPFKDYNKESGRKAIIGTMAGDSDIRRKQYIAEGCQSFRDKDSQSRPLSFWTEQDILRYISEYRTYDGVCSVYGTLRESADGSLAFDGCDRTGCMFCMFGVHMEKGENRFQRMAKTHPKQWNYCINTLGCGKVLDYIGVPYTPLDTKGV